jgi:hypothetical protein
MLSVTAVNVTYKPFTLSVAWRSVSDEGTRGLENSHLLLLAAK